MTLSAFMGHAGVGKTYNLFLALEKLIQSRPLLEGQRVLGLTFMHGSRQRLDEQLRKAATVKGRYACMTVDRFAWELCQRWRSMLKKLQRKEVAERDYVDRRKVVISKQIRWVHSLENAARTSLACEAGKYRFKPRMQRLWIPRVANNID
jgi:hypothetical protein